MGDYVGAVIGSGPLMLLLRLQVGPVGVFKVLSGVFVAGQVIFFPVVLSAGAMGVGGKVMVFRGYLL